MQTVEQLRVFNQLEELLRRRSAERQRDVLDMLARNETETKLQAALRKALAADPRSSYAIAKAAGILPEQLTRFMKHERDMTLGTAGLVADEVGLVLVRKDQRQEPEKKKPPVNLVALMRKIEPGADRGALVSCRDLRLAAKLSKRKFDAAVLRLARLQRVSLHRHDHAASLKPEKLAELVTDGNGTYYVGLAIRQPEKK